jgi:hypothetical protein
MYQRRGDDRQHEHIMTSSITNSHGNSPEPGELPSLDTEQNEIAPLTHAPHGGMPDTPRSRGLAPVAPQQFGMLQTGAAGQSTPSFDLAIKQTWPHSNTFNNYRDSPQRSPGELLPLPPMPHEPENSHVTTESSLDAAFLPRPIDLLIDDAKASTSRRSTLMEEAVIG